MGYYFHRSILLVHFLTVAEHRHLLQLAMDPELKKYECSEYEGSLISAGNNYLPTGNWRPDLALLLTGAFTDSFELCSWK